MKIEESLVIIVTNTGLSEHFIASFCTKAETSFESQSTLTPKYKNIDDMRDTESSRVCWTRLFSCLSMCDGFVYVCAIR